MESIVLASTSPRRQEILKMMRIPFQVMPSNVNESLFTAKSSIELPKILAVAKVRAVVDSLPEGNDFQWVLGADTVVVLDEKIYGKPKDFAEAFEFLSALQGRTHQVVTGLALYNGRMRKIAEGLGIAKVTFAPMSDEEIEWYLGTGEWKGVAGGYRIQGLAACFITKIDGAPSCVMGLPIFELYDMLKKQGYLIID
ncbi:MAG: Maf family protein [Treponemataceae bacterium]|nr:Maf family protein [Treponemataceae bacterium]